MATKRTNGRNLEEAVVLLINTQAGFVRDMGDFRREMGEIHKDMDQIRRELADIKSLLRIHQDILNGLPEAIRDKIGFKPPT
jgi:hypothetical protein